MHHRLTDIQADFEINRPTRYQITVKKIINTDGQTDEQTDKRTNRQTDGQTSRTTTIGSFLGKRKKTTKK